MFSVVVLVLLTQILTEEAMVEAMVNFPSVQLCLSIRSPGSLIVKRMSKVCAPQVLTPPNATATKILPNYHTFIPKEALCFVDWEWIAIGVKMCLKKLAHAGTQTHHSCLPERVLSLGSLKIPGVNTPLFISLPCQRLFRTTQRLESP